ncbi:MAG: TIGR03013 family PEP-CTERM/XrtA system glycosyltransferase [Burkholderiaceae bacterium]
MIRLFNHYLSVRIVALTITEALVLVQALVLGHHLRLNSTDQPYPEAALFVVVLMTSMSAVGMYQDVLLSWRQTFQKLIAAYAVALLLMGVVFYLFQDVYVGRGVLLYSALISLIGIALVRLVFFRLSDIDSLKRRMLLLGSPDEMRQFQTQIQGNPRLRNLKICGTYEVQSDQVAGLTPGSQNHDRLLDIVRSQRISEIVVAVKDQRGGVLPLRQLLDCRLAGVKVMDTVSFQERESGLLPLEGLRASWLLSMDGFVVGGWRDSIKRAFDVCASALLLLITLPVMLLAMLAIFLESGAPVLYRQQRVGENGQPFTILKLRSMRHDAEKNGDARWAQKNDSRVTRVGRVIRLTRIDELPQLINVLRGDMSFVGPRPERPEIVAQLREQIPFYELRHSLKPGITGWAQVRYSYTSSLEAAKMKQQFDLYYVKNHSLLLDLLIVIETLEVIVLRKGAL